VQNLFCGFSLECKIYFAVFHWSAKFILRFFIDIVFILYIMRNIRHSDFFSDGLEKLKNGIEKEISQKPQNKFCTPMGSKKTIQ